jgi:hypothetical protein
MINKHPFPDLGEQRNKPVIVTFADRPNAADGNERMRRWAREEDAEYFLVTTVKNGFLDYIITDDEHKVELNKWSQVTSQEDISKIVRLINKDRSFKCMDILQFSTTTSTTTTTSTETTTTSTTTSTSTTLYSTIESTTNTDG